MTSVTTIREALNPNPQEGLPEGCKMDLVDLETGKLINHEEAHRLQDPIRLWGPQTTHCVAQAITVECNNQGIAMPAGTDKVEVYDSPLTIIDLETAHRLHQQPIPGYGSLSPETQTVIALLRMPHTQSHSLRGFNDFQSRPLILTSVEQVDGTHNFSMVLRLPGELVKKVGTSISSNGHPLRPEQIWDELYTVAWGKYAKLIKALFLFQDTNEPHLTRIKDILNQIGDNPGRMDGRLTHLLSSGMEFVNSVGYNPMGSVSASPEVFRCISHKHEPSQPHFIYYHLCLGLRSPLDFVTALLATNRLFHIEIPGEEPTSLYGVCMAHGTPEKSVGFTRGKAVKVGNSVSLQTCN